MSDPRYTDPRLSEPPLQDDFQRQRLGELDKSNTMWGWIAGGIVLALLLVFVFGRSPTTDQASTQMTAPPPGQTTLSPPSARRRRLPRRSVRAVDHRSGRHAQ